MENSKSWRWWDDVLVRGAGFSAGGVLRLASTSLAAQADVVGSTPFSDADLSDYRELFAKVSVELSRELQDIARQDDFLQAVSWQNHRLLDGAVRPFCEWDPATQTRHSKHRQREELIANYWQRYCVKNDTIGFFGPSGWGTFSDDSATRYTPGETLIERREVFFESWAIDCLAESFEAFPAIREWLKPRRLTFVKIEGDINFNGPGMKVKLPALETAVLSMCDGKTSVHDIERELSGSYSVSLKDILGILDTLKAKRWIVLKIELPAGAHPEICLRQFLLGIGDEQLQSLLLARLDAMEAARDKIESSGDATALTQALSELDELFSGFTETNSTRNEGRTYGGRTLVYHDSRRHMALSVGEDIKQGLAPLYLLAKSARWICWRLGTEVRQLLRQTYQRCVEKHGAQFDLTTMWLESLGPLSKVIDAALDNIDQVFRAKWAKIIAVEDSERRVQFTYAQLEERVNQEFDAPGAGWEGARYFCPDVMLSA
ncbi:lantibiotic dehydratase [Pseudomonas syringae]|nr:lantibiotic dehydratase [Pseudomonas syringae]